MIENQNLISIALCTYNGEKFLQEQIDSILNQTYKNFELIISDDCSEDNTSIILKNFQSKDSRIKLLSNDENIGYIKNFEKAIKDCTGDLIFLSDQDDVWNPNKLSEISACFTQGRTLVFHDSEFINEKGEYLNKNTSNRFTLNQGIGTLSFILFNGISGHALAFKKEIISIILPLPTLVHHDCWISFVANCTGEIFYHSKPLVKYRQHQNSETDLLKIKKKNNSTNTSENRNSKLIERTQKFLEVEANPQKSEFEEFEKLLVNRRNQYLSINLFLFVYKNHQKIFKFKRKKGLKRIFYTFPFIWGLKLKSK
jgi:glycosyltransferase involved in cell wall biosynthesis